MTRQEHPIYQAMLAAGLIQPDGQRPAVALDATAARPAGDPDAARYAEAALRYETDTVAQTSEGARNDTLNRAAFKLGSLVAAGHLDGQQVIDELVAAARVSGLPPSEINRVVYRAVGDGGREPRIVNLDQREHTPAAHTLTVAAPVNGNHPGHTRNDQTGCDQHGDSGGTGGDSARDSTGDSAGDDPGLAAALAEQVGDIDTLYPQLDWHEAFAASPDDIEWIAHPLFEKGRLYSVYSPAKAGKSLVTLDVAAALATGHTPFTGQPREPLHVLYIDLENDPIDLVERLQDLDYQPGQLDRLHYLSFPGLPALDSATGGRHLLAAALHYHADVVVIDTVSRTIAGEENSADTFHQLYRHAMVPLKRLGVTVIRLDHAGKDEEKGMRGSSAKLSDVDAAWKLTRTGPDRLRLDRTAARNSHSPEYVVLDIDEAPLRHRLVIEEQPDDRVAQLVSTLDRLGVPHDWGRERAKPMLVANGFKVRNSTLSEAIRVRRGTIRAVTS